MNFDDHVAIVTGGVSGIGYEVASQLADLGAAVAIADLDSVRVQQTADALHERGVDTLAVAADVSDEASVDAMIERVIAWKGKISVLVHSAGIGIEKPFVDTSLEDWNRVIDTDLTGTFLCCRAAAREMMKSGYGRIVTMSSTAGIRGGTGRAAYGAAKGGVIALTKVMAVELAEHGITANALAPGAIETELVKRMHSEETRRVYRRAIPMDRYGTPAEVAACAVFLASEEAAYVTGQVFGVDGGFLAGGVLHKKD